MLLFGIYATIFGLVIGSFLNVLVLRGLNLKELLGHSRCPNCLHQLNPMDLLPVFGWFILRGKCRYCNKKIPFSYVNAEILSGVIFFFTSLYIYENYKFLPILSLILIGLFVLVFLYLAVYDMWKYEIPSFGALLLIILGFTYRLVFIISEKEYPDFWWFFTFLVAIGIIFFVSKLYKKQVFGGGDYLIMLSMALTADAMTLFISYELAIIIAAIFGLIMVLKDRVNIRTYKLPLVPFLLIGWALALNFAQDYFDFLFNI